MTDYVIRRLLVAIPSLLGISLILFTVLALAPGDPFSELATNPNIPPEVRAVDDPDTERDEALPVALDTLVDQAR